MTILRSTEGELSVLVGATVAPVGAENILAENSSRRFPNIAASATYSELSNKAGG